MLAMKVHPGWKSGTRRGILRLDRRAPEGRTHRAERQERKITPYGKEWFQLGLCTPFPPAPHKCCPPSGSRTIWGDFEGYVTQYPQVGRGCGTGKRVPCARWRRQRTIPLHTAFLVHTFPTCPPWFVPLLIHNRDSSHGSLSTPRHPCGSHAVAAGRSVRESHRRHRHHLAFRLRLPPRRRLKRLPEGPGRPFGGTPLPSPYQA